MAMKYLDRVFQYSDLEQSQIAPATFERCTFEACHLGSSAQTPADRLRVRDCQILSCRATRNTTLGPIVVEDTLVDALGTTGLAIAYGTAFKHVVFRGKCGSFVLNEEQDEFAERFRAANVSYYEGVDWALDISEGEFAELDIRSVPADLIRRDPETQVIVRYAHVAETRHIWERLSLGGTPWQMAMQNGLHWGLKDQVFVAPKRSRQFSKWLAGLRLLQKEGVAEVD